MQQLQQAAAKKAPGPIEHRLQTGVAGVAGATAGQEFAKRSKGVGLVGIDGVAALLSMAAAPMLESCGGFQVAEHVRAPLATSGSPESIVALFDGDRDGMLNGTEWDLVAELLGITAGNDEMSLGIRRYQLEHLLSTGRMRLASLNALDFAAKNILGRSIMMDGVPETMRVVKVPETGGWLRAAGKGFDLRGHGSGAIMKGVELRFKGNASGITWQPAPPQPPAFFATDESPRNPLVDALRVDPALLAEGRSEQTIKLSGEELARGRACGACLAESCYRPCGPIPICVVPLGFFIHGAMLCAPCTACCTVPIAMGTAARAHSLELRPSVLLVRTEQHSVPVRPYVALNPPQYTLPRVEEAYPLSELGWTEVLPPQPHGLNGWASTLVVHDASGVAVCSVDHRVPSVLHGFADELRTRIARASAGHHAVPETLIEGYRYYSSRRSWLALDRARLAIAPLHVSTGEPPVAMGQPIADEYAGGQLVGPPEAPTPESMARGAPEGLYPRSTLSGVAEVLAQPPDYPSALDVEPIVRNEKLGKAPLIANGATGRSDEPPAELARTPLPQGQMLLVQVPPGLAAGSMLQVVAPSGVALAVAIPPGLSEGDQFQVLLPPEAQATPPAHFASI